MQKMAWGVTCAASSCTVGNQCGTGCTCSGGQCVVTGSACDCTGKCSGSPAATKQYTTADKLNTYTCKLISSSCVPSPTCGGPQSGSGGTTVPVTLNRLLNSLSPIQSAYAIDLIGDCRWSTSYGDCKCDDSTLTFNPETKNCEGGCTTDSDCATITSSDITGGKKYTCTKCIDGKCADNSTTDVACENGYYKSGDTSCSSCEALSNLTGLIKGTYEYTSWRSSYSNNCGVSRGYGYNGPGDCKMEEGDFTNSYGSGTYTDCVYIP